MAEESREYLSPSAQRIAAGLYEIAEDTSWSLGAAADVLWRQGYPAMKVIVTQEFREALTWLLATGRLQMTSDRHIFRDGGSGREGAFGGGTGGRIQSDPWPPEKGFIG